MYFFGLEYLRDAAPRSLKFKIREIKFFLVYDQEQGVIGIYPRSTNASLVVGPDIRASMCSYFVVVVVVLPFSPVFKRFCCVVHVIK